jgi:hypothetical protein
MPSHWVVADALVRELGFPQGPGSRVGRALSTEAGNEVERLIGDASDAVSRTVDGPKSDPRAMRFSSPPATRSSPRARVDSLSHGALLPPQECVASRRRKAAFLLFERTRGTRVVTEALDRRQKT